MSNFTDRLNIGQSQAILSMIYNQAIGQMGRVFINGPGDQGSIPGCHTKDSKKLVLDATLLNTQHYKVWNKGKVNQPRELSSALPFTSFVVTIEK